MIVSPQSNLGMLVIKAYLLAILAIYPKSLSLYLPSFT